MAGIDRSGTRVGRALEQAAELIDNENRLATRVVLISDGDDPVPDDDWQRGVTELRKLAVPLQVIGVGDPNRASPIRWQGDWMSYVNDDGERVTVQTQLNAERLQTIAKAADGSYVAVERGDTDLETIYSEMTAPEATRKTELAGRSQVPNRAGLFYAVVFFILGWQVSRRK